MKVKSWLPLFPGFYNTIFEADETLEIECIKDKRNNKGLNPIDDDVIEFDYAEYNNEMAIECCSFIEDQLKKFVDSISFDNIYSPREYNFINDSINCTYTISKEKCTAIINYLNTHADEFRTYLKERYTSYDGFCSFHSNDLQNWLTDTDLLTNEYKLGSVLNFIALNEELTSDEMRDSITDAYLSAVNYDDCTQLNYCDKCNSFVCEDDYISDSTCNYCYDSEEYTGDKVICKSCKEVITNRHEERHFNYLMNCKGLKRSEIVCSECSL